MAHPTARICFVCLGNICRSPTAEGILRTLAEEQQCSGQLIIGSFGTGDWHINQAPDARAIATAARHKVDISRQRARQFTAAQTGHWDWIVAMDRSVAGDLHSLVSPDQPIHLFGTLLSPEDPLYGKDVPDPYYKPELFEPVFRMIESGCRRWLSAHLATTHRPK